MNKAKEEIGENADYLFPEIDNLDFEAELSEAFKELEANYSDDQELVEKAVSTESVSEAKRRGLVPQSGDWGKPKRWVRPEDADVPVDTGEKPRKKASEDVSISNLTIEAMKAVFSDDFSMSDFQDMYSIGLDGYATNIVELQGRTKVITAQGEHKRDKVTIVVAILDDKENLDEEYEKQPKGIDGYTSLAGTMSRSFTKDKDGKLIVFHNSFDILPSFQGKGIATDINEHVEEEYERLGVSAIHLFANAEIGGYAWARQGYDFGNKQALATMRRDFLYSIDNIDPYEVPVEKRVQLSKARDEIKGFKHSWQFANWNPTDEPHGEHFGKKWMLGTDWGATKKLDKKSTGYKIGKGYFAAKRNEKNTS